MPDAPRRFPPPWRADKIAGGYVVRDASGQAIAYLYSRENADEARQAKVLTKDEARRIASSIARLPELLAKERQQG
jgi:K+/H+ antiporter YhaU regulatory subunit KhtT